MGKDLNGKEIGVGFSQRKDKIYQARYTDRWGKRQTLYDANLVLLRRQYADAVSQNTNLTNVRERITLDEWYVQWLSIYKNDEVKEGSIVNYEARYKKNIKPYLGKRRLVSITKSDVQCVIDKCNGLGYGYEVQNSTRIVMLDMFARAIEDDFMVKNPAKGVKVRKEKNRNPRVLSNWEYDTFFKYSKGTFYDDMFTVAVNTGLRPGELFALTEDDLDFEKKEISINKTLVYQKYRGDTKKTYHVLPPKTKSSYRNVPMNSICEERLKSQLERKKSLSEKYTNDNASIFVTKFNTRISSQIFCDAINRIRDEAELGGDEIAKFSGHTFRHTFATRCIERGIQPKVVQKYLGHATLSMTTDLYIHVSEEVMHDDIERLADKVV